MTPSTCIIAGGRNYEEIKSVPLTFDNDTMAVTVIVVILGHSIPEGKENFTLILRGTHSVTKRTSAQIQIQTPVATVTITGMLSYTITISHIIPLSLILSRFLLRVQPCLGWRSWRGIIGSRHRNSSSCRSSLL